LTAAAAREVRDVVAARERELRHVDADEARAAQHQNAQRPGGTLRRSHGGFDSASAKAGDG
jgi:hypothetical protein